jgi:hypothetical protein
MNRTDAFSKPVVLVCPTVCQSQQEVVSSLAGSFRIRRTSPTLSYLDSSEQAKHVKALTRGSLSTSHLSPTHSGAANALKADLIFTSPSGSLAVVIVDCRKALETSQMDTQFERIVTARRQFKTTVAAAMIDHEPASRRMFTHLQTEYGLFARPSHAPSNEPLIAN